jgi:hypothetical protein
MMLSFFMSLNEALLRPEKMALDFTQLLINLHVGL